MNGAHALLATLGANGVTTCFANPGTSEMHFVAALDDASEMHAILCLFEGVATGAADGFARVTGTPAATLLHLGPGLANGWANLHNARRARVPLLNIVGDHATYHAQYDAPLQSDIASIASALNGWQCRATSADDVALDAARAIGAAYGPPGRVATLILPADASWGELHTIPQSWPLAERERPAPHRRRRTSPGARLLEDQAFGHPARQWRRRRRPARTRPPGRRGDRFARDHRDVPGDHGPGRRRREPRATDLRQ